MKSNIFKNENNNRDRRYLNYNYGSLINTINNKLNGYISNNDFYQTFRNNNNNSMFNLSRYN